MRATGKWRGTAAGAAWLAAVLFAGAAGEEPAAGGVHVRVLDPLVPLRGLDDVRKAPEERAIRLVAPANGFASAVAAAWGGDPAAVRASATALRSEAGEIPRDAVTVRYAAKAEPEALAFRVLAAEGEVDVAVPYYDELHPDPPPASADGLVPVWITVRVPADAAAGDYRGVLTVDGAGEVPIRLRVCGWVCPPPSVWRTHVGVLSSPETLAAHYGVSLWSDAHWTLVEQEIGFLAGLGNDDVWLTVFPRNYLGQEKPWICFRRSNGETAPDLSVVRGYLQRYVKLAGVPHAVLLDAWNSGRYRGAAGGRTALWVDDGPQEVPLPGREGAEAVWGALLRDVLRVLAEVGIPEDRLVIGCADDRRPDAAAVEFFRTHAPRAHWAVWTHGRSDPPPIRGQLRIGGMEIAHYEHLFCPWVGEGRADGVAGGWDLEFPEYATSRNYLPKYVRPAQYRTFAEGNVVNIGKNPLGMSRSGAGFSRLCLDFWPVVPPAAASGPKRSRLLAYEPSPWDVFLRNSARSVIAPGKTGPESTVRYEMLREGLQECEARIAVESALRAGSLDAALADAARQLLRERLRARERNGLFKGGHSGDVLGADERLWGVAEDWRGSTAALFDLAGRVVKAARDRPASGKR